MVSRGVGELFFSSQAGSTEHALKCLKMHVSLFPNGDPFFDFWRVGKAGFFF